MIFFNLKASKLGVELSKERRKTEMKSEIEIKNPALALVKQVREETDLKIVEELLQNGSWICTLLYQPMPGTYSFVLGRVK
jgi:hypothetical protein